MRNACARHRLNVTPAMVYGVKLRVIHDIKHMHCALPVIVDMDKERVIRKYMSESFCTRDSILTYTCKYMVMSSKR